MYIVILPVYEFNLMQVGGNPLKDMDFFLVWMEEIQIRIYWVLIEQVHALLGHNLPTYWTESILLN